MATNTIALRTSMLTKTLDEVYKKASVTSALEYNGPLVRDGADSKTIQIAKRTLQGLGDYGRTPNSSGYPQGSVTLEWQSHTFTQDRGRSFEVDKQDNDESGENAWLSLASLGGQFEREFVAPEIDAYRFATLAGTSGILSEQGTLDSTIIREALDTAIEEMDDNEVPEEGRLLFASNEIYKFMKNNDFFIHILASDPSNGNVSTQITMYENMRVIKVPRNRFYTAITTLDGVTSGEEAGGYVKAAGGADINFMIVHPAAAAAITKQEEARYFAPQSIAASIGAPVYQKADAHCLQYRRYHDLFVWENKTKGIYLHSKTA